MAEHKHGEGIDDQSCFFGRNTPQYQLLRLKQMEVVLLSVPLNLLVWVSRTEELTLFGPSLATRGGCKCLLLVLDQVEASGCLAVMATADQKIHHKIVLSQDPHKKGIDLSLQCIPLALPPRIPVDSKEQRINSPMITRLDISEFPP